MLFLLLKAARAAGGRRPLYVHRPVTNGAEIAQWYRDQGCSPIVNPDDMHATVAFSRKPVDWDAMGSGEDEVHVPASKERRTGILGAKHGEGATVLHFQSPALYRRWKEMRDAGASWDYPAYQPHVTVSYGGKGFDKAKPWTGPIHFGPEKREALTDNWRPTMSKALLLLRRSVG